MSYEKVMGWLKSPEKDFKKGVNLYLEHKLTTDHDNFFKSAIVNGPTAIHIKMLAGQMQKAAYRLKNAANHQEKEVKKSNKPVALVNKPKVINKKPDPSHLEVKQISGQKKESIRIDDNPFVKLEDLPKDLQAKFKENKANWKQIAETHAMMKGAKSDDERKRLFGVIEELDNKSTANWKAIDTWWKKNKDDSITPPSLNPSLKPVNWEQILKWDKELNNHKNVNIKRWEEKLRDAKYKNNNKKIKKATDKLKEYNQLVKELQNRIDENKKK